MKANEMTGGEALAHMLLASRSTSTSLGSSTCGNLPRHLQAVHHRSKR